MNRPSRRPPFLRDAGIAPEFRTAWEDERRARLRQRIQWYCAIMCVIAFVRIGSVAVLLALGVDRAMLPVEVGVVLIAIGAAYGFGMAAAWLRVRRGDLDTRQLLVLIWRIVIVVGGLDVLLGSVLIDIIVPTDVDHLMTGRGGPLEVLASLFVLHFVTACFIPWTPREAVRPLVPLLGLFAVSTMILSDLPVAGRVALLLAAPVIGLPGFIVCWWRHSRLRLDFHLRMLDESYDSLKRDLVDARRIHEAIFPPGGTYGACILSWRYRPMRQIGGDFLFAHHDAEPDRLTVFLIDVTGHGVGAALTVNRLYGELARLYAEEPTRTPASAVTALNRYIALTLAEHGIYATAIAMRVDAEAGTIEWANAGHPPAFLRRDDGTCARLASTSVMLGVLEPDTFETEYRVLPWTPRSVVLAYSDGIIEALRRDDDDDDAAEPLGIDGLEQFVTASFADDDIDRPSRLLTTLRRARYNVNDDDALIVSIKPSGRRARATTMSPPSAASTA